MGQLCCQDWEGSPSIADDAYGGYQGSFFWSSGAGGKIPPQENLWPLSDDLLTRRRIFFTVLCESFSVQYSLVLTTEGGNVEAHFLRRR